MSAANSFPAAQTVSLGSGHSAAITTDDSLYTWGVNNHGQLCDGTIVDCTTPVKIMSNVSRPDGRLPVSTAKKYTLLAKRYPKYLNNSNVNQFLSFCNTNCQSVIESYSDKQTWWLSFKESLANGTDIIIQDVASKLGIGQSLEEEWLEKNSLTYIKALEMQQCQLNGTQPSTALLADYEFMYTAMRLGLAQYIDACIAISKDDSTTSSLQSCKTIADNADGNLGFDNYIRLCWKEYTAAVESGEISCNHELSHIARITAPTCTQSGYTTYLCDVCGFKFDSDSVPATGHSYSSSVKSPTCTEQGYTTHTCSVCGASYRDSYTPATGHDRYWVVDSKATESSPGQKSLHCGKCGDVTDVTVIPVLTGLKASDARLIGATRLVLEKQEGFEYSLNGTDWQTDNSFSSLVFGNSYTVYSRRMADSEHAASAVRMLTVVMDGMDAFAEKPDSTQLVLVKKTLLNSGKNMAADINGDGSINVVDIVRLKKLIAAQ